MENDFKTDLNNFLRMLCDAHDIQMLESKTSKDADFLFPDKGIAISLNHVDDNELRQLKEKTELFNNLNADLDSVNIWEDQWQYNKEKVKSKILSLFGLTKRIHGRETSIIQLDNSQLIEFLDSNHLNVPIKAKYKYGLQKGDELVAVMSFSKGRQIKRNGVMYNSYELLRFCNKLNTTVVGGVSKLINHFIKNQDPDDIMTYIDADWSNGNSLVSLGFKLADYKPEMEFWLNTNTGEREYPHIVLKNYGKSMDNAVFNKDRFLNHYGYKTITNSGSYKYILDRKLFIN